ncbi:MAG: hypothetical protein A2087_13780 [Spirochaetes bacterium GWD1_61_31]|nr:MAG: hypothetical protein A2Y37_10305 [Spirochaetes bacterium GWB1_60_80]OHD33750.1 MAG: hypothetical protein A2004_09575 [Spirochaetes bacterium GWC1_61_12]OHD38973.1 MAG: hypothetical protein A2087_13780 [Spirochaetes bacterium GWD1_61_31]OHD43423.1 MAG: hypothetical protein A2Y35_11675 [Spirochaetes bacterium GWE1_60_18]OHD58954.1 MAG: hypothetical protein A2Y32_10465 [Spirochaetes bacterium GWF1_60_12]HAP42635.1 hypothetical protein [Spirochaetaceae bacterium]
MHKPRRRGDAAGINLLLSLIAMAFIPALAEEIAASLPVVANEAPEQRVCLIGQAQNPATVAATDYTTETSCSIGLIHETPCGLPRPGLVADAGPPSLVGPFSLSRPVWNSARAPPTV